MIWNSELTHDNVNCKNDLILINNFSCKNSWIPLILCIESQVLILYSSLVVHKQKYKDGASPWKKI